MITSLHVENFKALKGKHEIPIAPITLIYGPNSGGKSSVIQALLLLKQSIDAGRFSARGPLVDLGSFYSCVWQHDVTRPMQLGVTVRGSRTHLVETPEVCEWASGDESSVWLTFRSHRSGAGEGTAVGLDAVRLHSGIEDVQLKFDSIIERPRYMRRYVFSGARSRSWLKASLKELGREHSQKELQRYSVCTGSSLIPSHVHHLPSDERRGDNLDDDVMALVDSVRATGMAPGWHVELPVEGLALYSAESVESVLGGLRYLGPLRARPPRAYSLLDNSSGGVGTSGEYTSQHLLQGRAREMAMRDGEKLLQDWLKALDIPYKIQVRPVGDPVFGDGVSTTLIDERTGVSVGLTDVGSGVGQVLPLLVLAAFTEGQVLCVEQPELHLHPRAQAALGDVMLDTLSLPQVQSEYDDGPFGWPVETSATQWIVETHSETLLLRLKRRMREGRIRPEHVTVLYVDPGRNGSEVKPLRLNERGDFLDEWPRGFFEEAFNEVFS